MIPGYWAKWADPLEHSDRLARDPEVLSGGDHDHDRANIDHLIIAGARFVYHTDLKRPLGSPPFHLSGVL